MSNGYGGILEQIWNAVLSSVNATTHIYIRTHFQPFADFNAAASRGGAVNASQFKSTGYTIYFDAQGRAYVPRPDGQGGFNAEPINLPYDGEFESGGGHDLITGGPYGWEFGDATKYGDAIEDIRVMREAAIGIAHDYYSKKALQNAPVHIGNSPVDYYPVKMHCTDNPLEYFDPNDYDLGLGMKYYSAGIAYDLLDSLFMIPKDLLIGATEAMQRKYGKNAKIPIDPIIATQLNLAKGLSDASGDMLVTLFPLLWILRPYANTIRDDIIRTFSSFTGDTVDGLEGIFSGYSPSRAHGRTHFQVPPGYRMTAGGIYAPAHAAVGETRQPRLRRFVREGLSEGPPIRGTGFESRSPGSFGRRANATEQLY